jgi:hypothetical protein
MHTGATGSSQTVFRVIHRVRNVKRTETDYGYEKARTPNKSRLASPLKKSEKMVRIAGLEPAQVSPLPPQSSASANSAICAQKLPIMKQSLWRCARANSATEQTQLPNTPSMRSKPRHRPGGSALKNASRAGSKSIWKSSPML